MGPRNFVRQDHVSALATQRFDLLVIGGGITGCGVALDAAARGLRVALVERDDFASGTSSKSSKLVHGGLRYLQQREVGLVYEALHERHRLLHNAPHLVSVQPFLTPILTSDGLINRKVARALGLAMWAYDLTGGWRIGKRHEKLSRDEAMAKMPTLRADKLAYAYIFYDCRADDARLTLTLARTAALDHGAVMVNRAGVTAIRRDSDGHATGADVNIDGNAISVTASVIVSATGVWADALRTMDEGRDPDMIRPAKGIHITVPWDKVRNELAVVVPVRRDRRSVFVVPHGGLTYIGTTDTDHNGNSLDDPHCSSEDVDYLLDAINAATTSALTRADVVGSWAGLRPLVRRATTDRTADLSRRHTVQASQSGMITVTGGKLTTYRKMAADTVDAVVDALPRPMRVKARRSPTKKLPLRGASGRDVLDRWVARGVVDATTLDHLDRRYGGEAGAVLALIDADASLGDPIIPSLPYLGAEVVHAARNEMVNSLDDVLSRRTRARILARDDSADVAAAVARLMAPAMGWDEAEQDRQVDSYRQAVKAERAAPDLPETHLTDFSEA